MKTFDSLLNAAQQEAVDCNDKHILCLAGAGTGKTYSMIARLSRLVSEGVDPDSILVLTFTNAAAFEMRERYKRNHKDETIPEFRTFHSFCYSLISKDAGIRNKIGYVDIPKIADDAVTKRIEASTRVQCGTPLTPKQLSRPKDLTGTDFFHYQVYKKALNKAMKKEGFITFDILCYDVCKLFADKDPTVSFYFKKYKYIFVDEFQDTDPRQYEFVSSFEDANIFVVGDALQAIYSFRGADSSIIKQMSRDPKWTTIKLYQNYRSTKEICDFANNMSKYADDNYRIAIQSNRSGDAVELYGDYYLSADEYIDESALADIINKFHYSEGTFAILCRTNAEVNDVTNYLKKRNIAFHTSNRNVDAMNILKSLNDESYMIDWLATFLNAQQYTEHLRLMRLSEDSDNYLGEFVEQFGLYFAVRKRLSVIIRIREILNDSQLNLLAKAVYAAEVLGINGALLEGVPTSTDDIINMLTNMLENEEGQSLYLGTIHSSKGLEYDSVALIGVCSKQFKLKSEENYNLYYVGITRARDKLYIYRSK